MRRTTERRTGIACAILLGLCGLAGQAGSVSAQEAGPLSVIDWLSQEPPLPLPDAPRGAGSGARSGTVEGALPGLPAGTGVASDDPPVTDSAKAPAVDVQPLDGAADRGAVGLLPGSVTGLPADLWRNSDADRLARRIRDIDLGETPALKALFLSLLLAEARPPRTASEPDTLLLARLDRLIEEGAVDPAHALVERAGPETPALFARWFDTSLLLGRSRAACDAVRARPALAEDPAVQIFCLARAGDWDTAYLLLGSARALGTLSEPKAQLLERFLGDGEDVPQAVLPPSTNPGVLEVVLNGAIGEPIPTAALPRSFAVADLDGDQGWKAQLEAAERLARAGALPENRLLAIYTDRLPAASGGVWDRVEALQRFETALRTGDPGAVTRALPRAWAAMGETGLRVPFARLFAEDLLRLPLTGPSRALALRLGLLSPLYETIADRAEAADPGLGFAASVARGDPDPDLARAPRDRAILAGFAAPELSAELQSLLDRGRLGEAILAGMARFRSGAEGNLADLTGALALFRAVGLEDTARSATLQLLLSEPAG